MSILKRKSKKEKTVKVEEQSENNNTIANLRKIEKAWEEFFTKEKEQNKR